MDHRDPAPTLLTRSQLVWLCVGLSAIAGLQFASQSGLEIHAGEPTSVAAKSLANRESSLDSDHSSVERALFESDESSAARLRVSPAGLWDSRFKPRAKTPSKPVFKANPFSRLKKHPAEDPFIESDSNESDEPETAEEEDEPANERVAPVQAAPQTAPKARRNSVPLNRRRLLQYDGSADQPKADAPEEKPSTPAPRAKRKAERRIAPASRDDAQASDSVSDRELRALFEEDPQEIAATPSSDVKNPSLAEDDFEEAPASEAGVDSTVKQVQQVTQGIDPEHDLAVAEEESSTADPVDEDEEDLFELHDTESDSSDSDVPKTAPETKSPVTEAKPATKPEKLETDQTPVETAPAEKPEKAETTPKPSESTPQRRKPSKVSRPVAPRRAPESPGAKVRVDDLEQAPAGRPRPAARAGVAAVTPPVINDKIELPIIRPAPKLVQSPSRAIDPEVSRTIPRPSPQPAMEEATQPRISEPNIRATKSRIPPLQALANRPLQVEVPEGWSAATKLIERPQVPRAASSPEAHTPATPPQTLGLPPAEAVDEPQFPTLPEERDSDEVHPISEASFLPRNGNQRTPMRIVRADATSPAKLDVPRLQNEPARVETDSVAAQLDRREPVLIPELARETQSPWTTWLLIAFGAGFAICRLLFRSANAE